VFSNAVKNVKELSFFNLMQPNGGSRFATEDLLTLSLLTKLRNFIQMSKLIAFNQKNDAYIGSENAHSRFLFIFETA
jgi:hypothetical protein